MPRKAPYGWVRSHLNLYIPIPGGTGAADVVTAFLAGFGFIVEKVRAYTAIAGTGAGATRTIRVLKGTTVVATGTVTLAGTATVGSETSLAVTAADAEFVDVSTLTVDFPAAGAVAFTAGALNLVIHVRQQNQRAV